MSGKVSELIIKHQEELAGIKDQLLKAVEEMEANPDEEAPMLIMQELNEKHDVLEKKLEALKATEQSVKVRAKPVMIDGAPAVIQRHMEPKKPGDVIFKHAVVNLLSFIERKDPSQVIEERYKDTNYVGETYKTIYRKSQINPAMTSVSGWAQELTQSDTRGFIESLKDVSVAAALASRATSLDFGGFQSIKIPRRNPLGTAGAGVTEPAWVAEGRPIPLTKFSFGSTELFRYKLAAITTFTREIAERSTPAIEGLLRDALREAYAEVLDAALLDNSAAVQGVRPHGLLFDPFGAGAAITSLAPTTGGGEDAVRGDIMKLMTALTSARVGRRPVLLVNELDRLSAASMVSLMSDYVFRDELSSGNLMGMPVISSGNVPQHHVVIVDAAYLATAFDSPMFDVSDVATVVENSADTTAPTMVSVSATGAAGAHAGQVAPTEGRMVSGPAAATAAAANSIARSLWQTWSVGIRMVAPTSWGVMQPGVVQHITPTTWTA